MSMGSDFGNPLRKFKLVFLGEQSGESFDLPRSGLTNPLTFRHMHVVGYIIC